VAASAIASAAGGASVAAIGASTGTPPVDTSTILQRHAAGPVFTRKRFKKLQDELRAREEAERRAARAEKQKRRREIIAAQEAAVNEQIARLLAGVRAPSFGQLPQLALPQAPFSRHTLDAIAKARAAQQDDDDAIAVLLAA
jgi:hypothetical protein